MDSHVIVRSPPPAETVRSAIAEIIGLSLNRGYMVGYVMAAFQ
jgi:hypothetical protein